MTTPVTVDVTECEREPIHIPGSIQPFGALLAFHAESGIVTAASENIDVVLGLDLEGTIGRGILEAIPALRSFVEEPSIAASASDRNVARVSLDLPDGPREFVATTHTSDAYTIVELESAGAPASLQKGTRPGSVMLEGRRALARMSAARGVQELCDLMVLEVQRATQYDRVMAYRFDEDLSGEVISEVHTPELEPLLGLRYPAGDIPPQARRLYLAQTIRYIEDVDAPPSRLVPFVMPDSAAPLDLSSAFLRSISPVHLQYLRNMGVTSTVGLSLIKDGRLWGMLVAHNRVARRCESATRAMCDLLGMLGSGLLAGATEVEISQQRDASRDVQETLVGALSTSDDVTWALSGGSVTLQDLIASDGFAIREHNGRIKTFGKTPSAEQIARIVTEIERTNQDLLVASDAMQQTWTKLEPMDLGTVCGILFARLGDGGDSYVAWFRNEKIHSVRWAGDPRHAVLPGPSGTLRPRNSFALWTEEVRGHSERWGEADRFVADVIRGHIVAAHLRLVQATLARLASHDELTGLANRRVVHNELDRMSFEEDQFSALIYIDIDGFKAVNDGLGHEAGDQLLVAVANRLSSVARADDVVARFGGDEFVMLCRSCPPGAAARLAARVVGAFEEPFVLNAKTIPVSASVGWAIAKSSGDAGELIRRADMAMYYAKRHGGNQVARSSAARPERRRGDRTQKG